MNQKPWNLASNCQQKIKTMILIHYVERLRQSWPTTLLKSLAVMGNLREIFQELKKNNFHYKKCLWRVCFSSLQVTQIRRWFVVSSSSYFQRKIKL